MKKSTLILLTIVIVGGISWLIWRDLRPAVPAADYPAVPAASSSVTVKKEDDAALRAQALNIIARPILVKTSLADSIKTQAIQKLNEITESIKKDYNYANQWYDLGAYRRLIGDYAGAAEAWGFATLIRPKDFIAYSNLGDLYGFYLKDYPKAEENYLKAIQNESSNINSYLQLATIYEYGDLEKANQAEAILLLGLQNNPGNPNLKAALDAYYQRTDKTPK